MASRGTQHGRETGRARLARAVAPAGDPGLGLALDSELGGDLQIELAPEDFGGHRLHCRVAQLRQAGGVREARRAHAQPVQSLPEFQADDAGADDGDRGGKLG